MTSPKPLYTFQSPPRGRGGSQSLGLVHWQVKLADQAQDGTGFVHTPSSAGLFLGVVSGCMERWLLLRLGGGKRRCMIECQLSGAQLGFIYGQQSTCIPELNADSGGGNFPPGF